MTPAILRLRALRRDCRGVSALEFALVAPVLFGLVMGALQLSIDVYINSVLKGAMQEAGRNSSLESAQAGQGGIDEYVAKQINAVLPSAEVKFSRKSYQAFSEVGKPEEFIDANDNGAHDPDECFYDENANSIWDDGAIAGQGGARDVVVYTATVEYKELLPLKALLGLGSERELSATTTLMNQPFATQQVRPVVQVCP